MLYRFRNIACGATMLAGLATSANAEQVIFQVENFIFRPGGGAEIVIPRIPDFAVSTDAINSALSDGVSRLVCLPGKSPPTCFRISVTPAQLQAARAQYQATKLIGCGVSGTGGGTCGASLTTHYVYMGPGDIFVTSGPGVAASGAMAKALGWEVSCTVGYSFGD